MAKHPPYYNAANQKIPSVTTITSRFGESGGLMYWANAVGQGERDCEDQVPCQKCGRRKGKFHYDATQAASIGTLAHAMIEERIKGVEVDQELFDDLTAGGVSKARECLDTFDRWYKNYHVEVVETEMRLVSEKYQYGGMFDAIWRVDGVLSLGDWKTSKDLYPDYVAQMGGYVVLIEEFGAWGKVEQVDILRLSKETGAFHHHSWPRSSLQPAIDYFLHARTLFGDAKELKKLLK